MLEAKLTGSSAGVPGADVARSRRVCVVICAQPVGLCNIGTTHQVANDTTKVLGAIKNERHELLFCFDPSDRPLLQPERAVTGVAASVTPSGPLLKEADQGFAIGDGRQRATVMSECSADSRYGHIFPTVRLRSCPLWYVASGAEVSAMEGGFPC